MAYNPQSMYRPAVGPDTGEGLARGIESAGKSIAAGIEGFASAKHAAKAADQEFELFQQMYPEAAALMDAEKFASANLAGKQKMLGLGKGYVLQQREDAQRAEGMAWKEKKLKLNQEQRTITTKDGGTLVVDGTGQALYTARPEKPEKTPGPITMQDLGNGTRAVVQDGKLERVLTDDTTAASLKPRYVPVDGSGFKIPVDGNGNRVSGLPYLQTRRGPFQGGLSMDVPVSGPGATAPIKIIEQDGHSYRLAPDGVTLIPLKIQGGQAAAAAPAAGGTPSFLTWKP